MDLTSDTVMEAAIKYYKDLTTLLTVGHNIVTMMVKKIHPIMDLPAVNVRLLITTPWTPVVSIWAR